MNPYEMIIGAPPTREDQIRVAAARLRGADDRSVLAMLSGDPTLQGVGQATYEATQNQAQGISKARAAAEYHAAQREMENASMLQQRKIADENNSLNRDQLAATTANQQSIRADADAQRNMMQGVYDQNKVHEDAMLKETQRQNDLQAVAVGARKKEREAKEAAVDQRFDDAQLSRLADKIQSTGISDMEVALDTADKEAGKYFDVNTGTRTKEGNKDIPGYGGFENAVPTVLSGVLGSNAQNLRLNLEAVKNRALKVRSGSAVTDQELTRLATELGASIGQGEEQMVKAYVNFRKGMNHVKTMMYAGRDPSIVQRYMTNRDSLNSGYGVDTSMSGGSSLPNIQGTPTTKSGRSYEVVP